MDDAWFKENVKKIAGSDTFMGVITGNFLKDPSCALQVGLAVLMDKPIYLMVNGDVTLPENLRRVAAGIYPIDRRDPKTLNAACKQMAQDLGAG